MTAQAERPAASAVVFFVADEQSVAGTVALTVTSCRCGSERPSSPRRAAASRLAVAKPPPVIQP
jgi:hypothetical protein